MNRIRPRNWQEHQHYKDRDPTWIKLHKKLLDNYGYQSLPLASKALAPMLWLIASEDKEGWIDATEDKLCFRLRCTPKELRIALKALIAPCIDGSPALFEGEWRRASERLAEPIADGKQPAMPEEQVEEQVETEAQTRARVFDEFWKVCPKKVGKAEAEISFHKSRDLCPAPELVLAMKRYAESKKGQPDRYIAHPATWLNQQRWTDELGKGADDEAPPKPVHPSWNGSQSRLVSEIGERAFNAYFAEAAFDPGPPAHIRVAKAHMRDIIERKFAGPLKRAFEEVMIEVGP